MRDQRHESAEWVRLDAIRRRRQLGGIVVGLIRCRHQNIKIENGVQCVVASAVEAMPFSIRAQVPFFCGSSMFG